MNRFKIMMIILVCVVLLAVSWLVAITAKSDVDKQADFVSQAEELIRDGVIIRAYPLLEEAILYDTDDSLRIENMLKKIYLELIEQTGFRRKYVELLEKQMSREDAHSDVFMEAAEYHLSIRRHADAFEVLRDGIEKTGSKQLIDLYEQERYVYRINRTNYDLVMTGYNSYFQIQTDGLWGLARSDGSVIIPCQFDKISTFSMGMAVAKNGNEIFAVDRNGNRILKLHANATDFGSFSDNRVTLSMDGAWHRATSEFEFGAATFEEIGMHNGGNAAAKQNGKWGVVNLSSEWIVPAEYDEIIMDELGRSYSQSAVFVKNGNNVTLLVDGEQVGDVYEDARPFGDEYYAAVKKNGLWGFIDTTGNVVINYQYEDALSFGQHLAAVKVGEFWVYINVRGKVVIEDEFLEAKSFSGGSAPVLTDGGWRILSLVEFITIGGLF